MTWCYQVFAVRLCRSGSALHVFVLSWLFDPRLLVSLESFFMLGGGSLGLLASSVFFGFLAFPVAGLQKQRFAKGRNTGQQERRRKG